MNRLDFNVLIGILNELDDAGESRFIFYRELMSHINPQESNMAAATDKLYCIPVFKKADMFVVWTGNGEQKNFNDSNLPVEIKVPLGVIMQSPKAAELNQKEMSDVDLSKNTLADEIFKTAGWDPQYLEIGWQYNKYYYVVKLSEEELASVRAAA